MRSNQMLDALLLLSEGHELPAELHARLVDHGPVWTDRSKIGFVVIDRVASTGSLRDFAVSALRLEHVDTEGDLDLYRPRIK